MENIIKTTLMGGPLELCKSFMFEAAIQWAEEGRRVIYITPTALKSLPSERYHDSCFISSAVFKLIRFMYLPNYDALMEKLTELHTFAALPSLLILDNFGHYTAQHNDASVARTCAVIIDTMNACARILKTDVHVCAAVDSHMVRSVHMTYFGNIWYLTKDNEEDDTGATISLRNARDTSVDKSFKFRVLKDEGIVLKQILERVME